MPSLDPALFEIEPENTDWSCKSWLLFLKHDVLSLLTWKCFRTLTKIRFQHKRSVLFWISPLKCAWNNCCTVPESIYDFQSEIKHPKTLFLLAYNQSFRVHPVCVTPNSRSQKRSPVRTVWLRTTADINWQGLAYFTNFHTMFRKEITNFLPASSRTGNR